MAHQCTFMERVAALIERVATFKERVAASLDEGCSLMDYLQVQSDKRVESGG